jgi:hypothetical protein
MASKDTNAPHDHPHVAIPVRVSKESSFAAPGLDTPDKATQQRPQRATGTPQEHPLNRPIQTADDSLIGPQLGRGGTKPTLTPVEATCVYTDPGFSGEQGETFVPGVGPGPGIDEHFQDVSGLITKKRGS